MPDDYEPSIKQGFFQIGEVSNTFDCKVLPFCNNCKEIFQDQQEVYHCKQTGALYCRKCEIQPFRVCKMLDDIRSKKIYLRKISNKEEHIHWFCYINLQK